MENLILQAAKILILWQSWAEFQIVQIRHEVNVEHPRTSLFPRNFNRLEHGEGFKLSSSSTTKVSGEECTGKKIMIINRSCASSSTKVLLPSMKIYSIFYSPNEEQKFFFPIFRRSIGEARFSPILPLAYARQMCTFRIFFFPSFYVMAEDAKAKWSFVSISIVVRESAKTAN